MAAQLMFIFALDNKKWNAYENLICKTTLGYAFSEWH
jgi:hypothetical protein